MRDVEAVGYRTSYLDVSTGRGEMLAYADRLGFEKVAGTEIVPGLIAGRVVYADAWDLPFEDNEFDLVTLLDVIEHILPEDTERVCKELERVAARDIILTANNKISRHKGVDLHINLMSYPEWDETFKRVFSGEVKWLRPGGDYSETWQVSL